MSETRDDIVVLDFLDQIIDFDKLTFDETHALLTSFIAEKLLSRSSKEALNLGEEFFEQAEAFVSIAYEFNDIDLNVLNENRCKAWEIHDQYEAGSLERNTMRIIVFALYDKESSEFDEYGAVAIFEAFVSCLLDLGKQYCYLFKDHVLEYAEKTI